MTHPFLNQFLLSEKKLPADQIIVGFLNAEWHKFKITLSPHLGNFPEAHRLCGRG